MLLFIFSHIFAKNISISEDEDFHDESETRRPVMVVGSYLGLMWSLLIKKDHEPGKKSTTNSLTHNIPALVAGYGDVLGQHFYWGVEGNFGHGLKGGKDEKGFTERVKWHFSAVGHAGFYLSPSARLYGLVGFDKTSHIREHDVVTTGKGSSKVEEKATGFCMTAGLGLLITLSSRFGFGFEGRYLPQKSWSSNISGISSDKKLSAWQMGIKGILYI